MNGQAKLLTRLILLATVLNAVLFVGVLAVSAEPLAIHNFPDVPTSAFYHNGVEWIFNRGITAGCGGGLYCPSNNVTRGEMAVFMQKLGIALTPVLLRGSGGGRTLDPDALPIVCQTADYAVGAYPRQALFNPSVSVETAGAMAYFAAIRYSTNGGASWNYIIGVTGSAAGSGSGSGDWGTVAYSGFMDLDPGTTYKFGIAVGRLSGIGVADINDYSCLLTVQVLNRNGTTSPLSGEQ